MPIILLVVISNNVLSFETYVVKPLALRLSGMDQIASCRLLVCDILKVWLANLQGVFEMFIYLHDCRLVTAPVAVIWCCVMLAKSKIMAKSRCIPENMVTTFRS